MSTPDNRHRKGSVLLAAGSMLETLTIAKRATWAVFGTPPEFHNAPEAVIAGWDNFLDLAGLIGVVLLIAGLYRRYENS